MTYESLVKNIEKMPPLSDIVTGVRSLYAGGVENVNTKKLANVIESDALLSANILKIVNSPLFGLSQKISSIPHAVTVCGVERTYSIVLHYAMNLQLQADTAIYGFNSTQFNEMCILQSSLMMQWYARINIKDAQFMSLLAFIMESGKIVILKELMASDQVEVFREGFLACTNIQEFEREFFGITSYYLSALLFEHWKLEPIYVEILKELDFKSKELDPKMQEYINAVHVIRTAINLKEVLTDASIEKACHIIENDMQLSSDKFRVVAGKIRELYEDQ
ncbi:MAG: HDOD domain-containing protein [Thiovulaceae bacterium]|nr:HDOD domain-containing protein [Sulfurimonadaceae bacterium]